MPELNVRDFGAIGDGEANDTQAFQRAIDAAREDDIIYVPPGIYRIEPKEFPNRKIRFSGITELRSR